jgi:CRP/FNR family transcriptional regulator, cyclic AMP receptor protein
MLRHYSTSPGGLDVPMSCLSAEALARIVAASRRIQVPAGSTIFRKGDPADGCFFIADGAVKISVRAGGHNALLAILGRGDIFGELSLLDSLPRSATVTALKASELYCLPPAAFERLMRTDSEVARQLMRVIAGRLRAANENHVLQLMPVRIRLARALLSLARSFGERLPDGRILIRQRISQAELGQMVGATRENVNRQLTEWRQQRLLSRISGYYCLVTAAFEPLGHTDAAA